MHMYMSMGGQICIDWEVEGDKQRHTPLHPITLLPSSSIPQHLSPLIRRG